MASNLQIYLSIAKDSLAKSDRISAAQTRPKPNGEKGSIITYDFKHKSFKHSLVAIVFAGIYLEAFLYIKGVKLLGKAAYDKIDFKTYEEKLKVLKITDPHLLDTCKRFRIARKELVHDKPFQQSEVRFAQIEARKAIDLIDRITHLLTDNP
ncbi:MAG: hypothetical protein ABSG97_01875 [Sedimentisphaerales bacterium]